MDRADGKDTALVKSYVLLPLILTAFERDAGIISAHIRTPAPYLDMLHAASAAATGDLREIRNEMRKQGIKVYEQQRLRNGIEARFMCRGYHDRMLLLHDIIAAQAAIHMRQYLGLDISAFKSYKDQYWIKPGSGES